ncbi:MAG: FAD:protein FMN transferase [Candidatus Fimenecus sp.]
MKKKKIITAVAAIVVVAAIITVSLVNMPRKAYEASGFAMGSVVKINVYGGKNGDENAKTALAEIKELDSKYLSHNAANSYVYTLNENRTVTADGEFVKYIKNCLMMSADCNGFSLMCGGLSDLWKIEDGGYIPSEEEINSLLSSLSDSNITIDGNTVSLNGSGKLDLGALGKGTACQYAIDSLKNAGVKNALCTVGGSVGVIGSPKGDKGFNVGIRNPFGTVNEYFGTVNVTNCFISTSGDYEKYFERDGVRYCHIFDARTGTPVQNDITSVTVIADNGTVSDFLSTAVFILGDVKGVALAEKYNADVIIVRQDKTVLVSDSLKDSFKLTDESFAVL